MLISPIARSTPCPAVRSASCCRTSSYSAVARGILDLSDATALVRVADQLRLLPADVAGGVIGAHRNVVQRDRAQDAVGQHERREESGEHLRPRPLADPQHGVEGACRCGVRSQLSVTATGPASRASGRSADAARGRDSPPGSYADRRIAASSSAVEPVADGQVGRSKRGGERRHLLAEHARRSAHPAAACADLPRGGLQIQRDADRSWHAARRRARRARSVPDRSRRPSCRRPTPWRSHHSVEPGARIEQRPLGHLQLVRCGRTGRRPRARVPTPYSPLLLGGIEQHERGVRNGEDRCQGLRVGVVDHHRARLGIHPLAQASGIAREAPGCRRGGDADALAIRELSGRRAPRPTG